MDMATNTVSGFKDCHLEACCSKQASGSKPANPRSHYADLPRRALWTEMQTWHLLELYGWWEEEVGLSSPKKFMCFSGVSRQFSKASLLSFAFPLCEAIGNQNRKCVPTSSAEACMV